MDEYEEADKKSGRGVEDVDSGTKYLKYLNRRKNRQLKIRGTATYTREVIKKRANGEVMVKIEVSQDEELTVEHKKPGDEKEDIPNLKLRLAGVEDENEILKQRNVEQNEQIAAMQVDLSNQNSKLAVLKIENARLKRHVLRQNDRFEKQKVKFDEQKDPSNVVSPDGKSVGFSCDECKMQFSFKSSLTRHKNANHLNAAKHQCTLCSYSNHQSSNVRDHMKRKHGIAPAARKYVVKAPPPNT